MENELEMIQTLFEYQNFGLAPFPIMPFSKEIHKGNKGKIFFDNAQSGIQMSEEEIYDWFGEKKLDNCGLICGEEGNLSVLEFESDTVIIRLMSLIEKESLDKISNLIFYNFLENLYSSTTFIRTPDKKIQFWFKFSKNLPSFLWNNNKSIKILEGINIYSSGYIVAPPSFIRKNNLIGQYEIEEGKKMFHKRVIKLNLRNKKLMKNQKWEI